MLPVGHQTAQQFGPTQERAIAGRRPAQGHMIAAAGAGMAAIQHELLRPQPRLAGILVQPFDISLQLLPVPSRMNIDLNHAGVGGDGQLAHPPVRRRGVALDQHRHL